MRDLLVRVGILSELMSFLWQRKLYWLIPMLISLLAILVFILLGSSTGLGAFFYSMF